MMDFKRKKDYLICIDSDGCAMDTMNIKHERCFGPKAVEIWNIPDADSFLRRWNEINLYSKNRGINRFKGLGMALGELSASGFEIDGLSDYIKWLDTTDKFSEGSLESAISENESDCLKKALLWSREVNSSINALPKEVSQPFDGVLQALKKAYPSCDIAIVSSANYNAVYEEWVRNQLMDYVDVLCCQDVGTKAFCISELMRIGGYDKAHALMIGDAFGDLDAAKENGVLFYPIIAGEEDSSWDMFISEALNAFMTGEYSENSYIDKMKKVLS